MYTRYSNKGTDGKLNSFFSRGSTVVLDVDQNPGRNSNHSKSHSQTMGYLFL